MVSYQLRLTYVGHTVDSRCVGGKFIVPAGYYRGFSEGDLRLAGALESFLSLRSATRLAELKRRRGWYT